MNFQPAPPQLLTITPEKSRTNAISILQPNGTSTKLYTCKASLSKTKLEICYADGRPIAKVEFHTFSTRFDIELHGNKFSMPTKSLLSTSHYFTDPALGELHWNENKMSQGLRLLDNRDQVVAQYIRELKDVPGIKQTSWMSQLVGKQPIGGFEVFVPTQDWRLLDMIVVTGCAAVHYRLTNDKAVTKMIT